MEIINLYWFHRKGIYGNFGDELGPYIIKKLSGKGINRIPIPRTTYKLILAYLKGLLLSDYDLKLFIPVLRSLIVNGKYIISVGSIIGWGSGKRIVWGSGILFHNEHIEDAHYLAVRGKYTQKRLSELGLKSPSVIGDPALLLPLIYHSKVEKKYSLGIIPHHTQYEHFTPYEKKHTVKVINLLDDIENVIDGINNCEYIISSSLHGIIVAQAYNIPALWYEYPKIKWHGENIKFLDYFSSVGIEEYTPFNLAEINDFDVNEVIINLKNNRPLSKINVDLSSLQKNLLKVAPFPLISKYIFK